MSVPVHVCALLLCLLASLQLHRGVLAAVHIRLLFIPPLCPPCVMCTASEIYRSINKTIKQQFSLPLPHCTATEYIHFSFPLSRTLVSASEGEEGGNEREERRVRRGKGGEKGRERRRHYVERCSRGIGNMCRRGYERKTKAER